MFITALFIIAKVQKQRKYPSTRSSCIMQRKYIKMQDPQGRGDLKIDDICRNPRVLGDVMCSYCYGSQQEDLRDVCDTWNGQDFLAHPHDIQCYPMALPLVQVTEPVDAKWSWPL